MMKVHYGSIVEKVIRKNGHSITCIAASMGVSRKSLYNWFKQPRLTPAMVVKIGIAIEYDFSTEIPDLFPYTHYQIFKHSSLNLNHLKEKDVIEFWKDKYIRLSENYNDLLFKTKMNNDQLRIDQ